MEFIADLHIHSRFSRACSKELNLESLYRWCQLKGITVLSTGDFTHPIWFSELKEKLRPAEEGLFKLRKDLAAKIDPEIPLSCRAPVRLLLGVEISCIYKKGSRVRRLHHLVFAPSFEVAAKINKALSKVGNIRSDGRPILGLDSKTLLSIVRDASPEAYLIPAHAWTPHFGLFGSQSGFDSIEECFEDLSPEIFAIETGLSSDPPMNWQLSKLDSIALMSNSDAHSPEKLAREANVLKSDLSYRGIFEPMKKREISRFLGTLEFFPEEGKYHLDGHRSCHVRLTPEETLEHHGLCPACRRPVTVGVLYRVNKLADRPLGFKPAKAASYENLVPLKEILGEILNVGSASRAVDRLYHKLLAEFGSELEILRRVGSKLLKESGYEDLGIALDRMRTGQVEMEPGYDGEYGTMSLLKKVAVRVDG